jgi:penicillin-insensitive murein DD-endopeptidase
MHHAPWSAHKDCRRLPVIKYRGSFQQDATLFAYLAIVFLAADPVMLLGLHYAHDLARFSGGDKQPSGRHTMRTMIVCLTLILACWGVAAAEQAKAPKKVTKTSAVKHAEKPAVAQKVPARKKVIKPVASKRTLVASQKNFKAPMKTAKVKSPSQLGAKRVTGIKTAALKPATNAMAEERADEPKNITPAVVKPEKPVPPKGPPANVLFGSVSLPAPLASRSIGSYTNGCLAGGVALPITGETWQVMRLSRNRNWGNPRLIDYIERFASDARSLDQWPGLLVGDLSQPRGGPMLTGHSSHQIGLDVDIWLTPMPDHTLTPEERETMTAESMLKDPFTVDPDKWTPLHTQLIKRAASYPEVDRIFVHPAIKKILCDEAGDDRTWLAKVRPWWNHYYHFHVRLSCPPGAGDCKAQKPVGDDDGCGQEPASWYAKLKKAAIAAANVPPPPAMSWRRKGRLTMAELPAQCSGVLTAGGYALPLNADTVATPALKVLASKEAGPPLPRLDAAALRALMGMREAGVPLPDRNPNR